jgi:predicted membrane channel-forming protein YqfA (hemolysin III family)
LNLIDNAALDYTYAGAGCFAAGIMYIFSMVTAIAGLAFAGRHHRYRWCRTLAYIQLAAGVLLFVPLRSYAALTLPPLFLLIVLYLFGVSWREKRDYEQQ